MANKLRPAKSPGAASTAPKAEESPNNLRDELAQTLLSVLHSVSSKANDTAGDLPAEATNAIDRFHEISCALATLSDQFICDVAIPPEP